MHIQGSSAAAFAALQRGVFNPLRETKSDTPDAPVTPPVSREGLAAAVAGVAPAGCAQEFADALMDCLEGNDLRLTRLKDEWHGLASALPPEAWTLLDGLAGEGGIVRVCASRADSSEEIVSLARCLAVLPSLRDLDLAVPRSGSAIDLSALKAAQRPLSLRLYCVRADGWQVTVPQGCQVSTLGPVARLHHLLKPRVSYVDSQGHPTGESHALPGVPYLAKPPASIVQACEGGTVAARHKALALSTNGQAQFEGKATQAVSDPEDRVIWCRHIAWQVGADWRTRRALQEIGLPAKMSYEPYATPEALSAHVKPETQAFYRRDLNREAVAVFTDRGFGEALQAQFEDLAPGQERTFLLVTLLHAMTLELRRKGRHCIVTFYDPNVSTVPVKLLVADPSHLKAFTPSHLLGTGYGKYIPLCGFVKGALYATGTDAQRDGNPCKLHGFGDDVLASREGLFWLVFSGAVDEIDRCVKSIVDRSGKQDIPVLMARLSTHYEGYNAITAAVFSQREEVVETYAQAIRRHALPVVGEEAVAHLLKDVVPNDADAETDSDTETDKASI